jgi:mono/diheme cytochrome c family protein
MKSSSGRSSGLVAVGLLAAAMMVLVAAAEPWNAPARAARKKNPIPADDKSIAAGKVVYTKECLSCHGTTGKGDGPASKDLEKPPGNLSNPAMADQTDGTLFWKVTEGRKPMPSFSATLTDDQRWEVVNYIRTLAPKGAAK